MTVSVTTRLAQHDWTRLEADLDAQGHAVVQELLEAQQCRTLIEMYSATQLYRSRIVMTRHGFGSGEYQYFNYPLPPLLDTLRHDIYARLTGIANRWQQQLGSANRYPATLTAFLERCHQAGQRRPTPLILRYGPGDYNRLHRDLYGEHVFPLQLAIQLSRPGNDFSGGEFVMTQTVGETRRADVVALSQGDAVIFPVDVRPVPGKRSGMRRATMHHGVSTLHHGQRYTLGLIFHDAT